jgi:hypothetical protein
LLGSDDIIYVARPADWPMRFYLWYYGLPRTKGAAKDGGTKEFFVVKKSRYTISDLTEKPVIKLLDFGDAALYQLLRPEGIRTEKEMHRASEGLRIIIPRIPSGEADGP